MQSDKTIIVIGRQFGSGGRKLGKHLADRLNIPYYDKELLSEAAKKFGMRSDIFESADERKPSLIRSMISAACGSSSYFTGGSFTPENVYQMQSDVIRQIMDQSSCVIVGRTADYIGRDRDELISVYLHAAMPDKIAAARTLLEKDLSDSEIEDLIIKKDNKRKEYYNYYTGRCWGEASNYDLTFNTSKVSLESIEDVILTLIESRKKS